MSETTTDTPADTPADGMAAGLAGSVEMRDLDTRGVLDLVVGERRMADAADARLLAAVVHLADLHPVLDVEDAAYLPSNENPQTAEEAGLATRVPIAGAGCPTVHQDAVAALGAALGLPHRAALYLVGESLELCYRLPRLWALVQAGRLQAWKARRVARETMILSSAAVDFVDRHLAVTGVRNHIPANLNQVITVAINRCDPDLAEGREEAALTGRHVTFDYSTSTDSGATADVSARLDILDALDLDHQLTDLAAAMSRLGDTTPLGIRRAHALGMLANPQHTLDIFGSDTPTDRSSGTEVQEASVPTRSGRSAGLADRAVRGGIGGQLKATGATVYIHLTLADLTAATRATDGTGSGSGVTVEGLNSVSLTLLQQWLRRTDHVSIRPVVDLNRTTTVDVHDPPAWMREAALLRDQTCVFPGCATDARACDLDHIVAYQPIDTGGPPGQTSLTNLACLCRRHHRLKTRTGWRYRRLPDHTYQWTSPYGHVYTTRPGDRPDRK